MTPLRTVLAASLLLLGGVATSAGAAPSAGTYQTELTATACGPRVPIPVSAGESTLVVTAAAAVTTNDIVLSVFRNGALLASSDNATSPEAAVAQQLDPVAAADDVVEAQVCPYPEPTVPLTAPFTVAGTYSWGSAPTPPALPAGGGEPVDDKKTVRVTAFHEALIPSFGSGRISRDVTFPEGTYNKAELAFFDHPEGDGFDRLISVDVDGVEVFRATGPRVDYRVTWDVSPYLQLLSGGTHRVTVWEEAYLGRGHTVSVDFLLHQAKKAPPAMPTTIAAPWHFVPLAPRDVPGDCPPNTGDVDPGYTGGIDETRAFTLPDNGRKVRAATFYGYLTAHCGEEFWYSTVRPTPIRKVSLAIDGTTFADFVPTPYTYAFVGGDPENAVWGQVDQVAWNTAQPVLAEHGAYTGTGVVPPYSFDVTELVKDLAPGAHDLTIRIQNGHKLWWFSGQVLVAYH